jgi:hypothetical protein
MIREIMSRQIQALCTTARGFEEARAKEIEQLRSLSLDERLHYAALLRTRAYGADRPDVRASTRQREG